MITFFAVGIPKGQPRPRAFARKFGKKFSARVYDPGTAENFKGAIALAAKPHLPSQPITGPVEVLIDAYFPRPKTHYRSNGQVKDSAPRWHTSKPDAENVSKAVLDSLTNLGAWVDDSQVVKLTVTKRYAHNIGPGAQITISEIAPSDSQNSNRSTGRVTQSTSGGAI
jgi:Holliday junction resolvase RusA-like endonuclease